MSAQHVTRLRDVEWVDIRLGGKCDQQRLLAGKIIEHAGKEIGLARGGPDPVRADAGDREKPADPLRLPSEESKRLNCQ